MPNKPTLPPDAARVEKLKRITEDYERGHMLLWEVAEACLEMDRDDERLQPVIEVAKRPTSPPPPRKKIFPQVTLIGVEALAVGQVVDQLENTIRVLIGLHEGKPWKKVTRGEIEWYIRLAEKQCE